MGMKAALDAKELRPRRPSSRLLDMRAILEIISTKMRCFGHKQQPIIHPEIVRLHICIDEVTRPGRKCAGVTLHHLAQHIHRRNIMDLDSIDTRDWRQKYQEAMHVRLRSCPIRTCRSSPRNSQTGGIRRPVFKTMRGFRRCLEVVFETHATYSALSGPNIPASWWNT